MHKKKESAKKKKMHESKGMKKHMKHMEEAEMHESKGMKKAMSKKGCM